jgi:hypothetical protein
MSRQKRTAEALLYTKRGKNWLAQFGADDQEVARKIVANLTLVSHTEFERVIQKAFEDLSSGHEHPIAFFAVREVEKQKSYFELYTNPVTGEIDALAPGSDHGSDARVAAAIRNYCKTDPDRLLNHPGLNKLKHRKCRTVVLVDDFIGSGERTTEFINSFWMDPTFVSWLSLKYLKLVVIAYSGTERGIKRVSKHKAKPEIIIERSCPTFRDMPWSSELRKSVLDICQRYGRRTSAGYWWDGYGSALAALAFEHGCPDNAPAILWAPTEDTKPWSPLFPNRVIMAGEKSVFPPEIVCGDTLTTLLEVGQKRLAASGQLTRRGAAGELILLILALIAKGQRRQSALSFATGLNRETCVKIIQRLIKWGFLTPLIRLTDRGRAELAAAKEQGKVYGGVLDRGDAPYFPKQLRRAARG